MLTCTSRPARKPAMSSSASRGRANGPAFGDRLRTHAPEAQAPRTLRLWAVNPGRPAARSQRILDPRSRSGSALRMSRREMLRERQVAAPLMAQRAAHRALRPAHRRFQLGAGVSVLLAGLRLSGKPRRPSPYQFGHETLVLGFALIAPAASRPGQYRTVRRQR